MSYAGDRLICDADSHLMELPRLSVGARGSLKPPSAAPTGDPDNRAI